MLKDCTTVKAIQEQVILEQFLNIFPKDVCIFVKERKPKSSLEASMLADNQCWASYFLQVTSYILHIITCN